jgi:hypothetical protein
MAAGSVQVLGLRELKRAFKRMGAELNTELRKELIKAAKPVAEEAESLALTKIRNMPTSPDWADMRIGVTAAAIVYIVPLRKNRGNPKRPNLKGLLLNRAMEPALVNKQGEVVLGVDRMLGRLAGENGFI